MKKITIYNTLKSRLETVDFEFSPENTIWFKVDFNTNRTFST
jgi:hypothetical protein